MKKVFYFLFLVFFSLGLLSINNYAAASLPTTTAIETLYQEGEEAIQDQQWEVALRKFQVLNMRYPSNPYVEKAKLCMIACYMQEKNFAEALHCVRAFIRHHPQSEWLEDALKLKSEILKKSSAPTNSQLARYYLVGFCGTVFVIYRLIALASYPASP